MGAPPDRPLRVLFLNTRSALGADVAVHVTLMKNLGSAGCKVYLATNRRSVDHAKLMDKLRGAAVVDTLTLDLGRELAFARGKLARLAMAAAGAAAMMTALVRLAAYVWRHDIDVIHSTDRPRDALLSTLLARITRRKNLVHLHIKWESHMGRATTWAVRNTAGVLAISEFVRRSLIEGGVETDKIYTAHNATDPSEFNPDRPRSRVLRQTLGLDDSSLVVGIAARIMVWKGQLDLVEAFARVREAVPNAVLAIVGNEDPFVGGGDDYAARVRRRITELGLEDSVRWAGWFDDMPGVFADLDVVCVPSWEEPFGLVVTEAMAMRKPVVGYRSGALPEIIDEGMEGLLVTPRDHDALADSLVQLLCDPDRREAMGRRGRERVIRQFTPRRQADEVAAIYRKICEVESGPPE